jgi:polyisoprenoid-binding protein YceI
MRPKRMVAVLLAGLLAAAVASAQELAPYRIDPAHSSVGFVARHFTVSKVRGGFEKFGGSFQVDENDITRSQFEVTIDATSLNTRVENRDNHLKSADFLDVAHHPEITFKSKRIEKSADGYVAFGDLAIRGVTREVPLRFTLVGPIKDPRGSSRYGVEASATINRQEFGVSWSRVMEGGGLVVSDEIEIEINAELVKVNPEAGAPPR